MAGAPGRSLSDFVSGVQMREIKDALHHYTVDGPMGQILDAEQDSLTLGQFQCFEIEQLGRCSDLAHAGSLVERAAVQYDQVKAALEAEKR